MKMVYWLRLRSPYSLMSEGEVQDFRTIDVTPAYRRHALTKLASLPAAGRLALTVEP
jgi:hypothetical protein